MSDQSAPPTYKLGRRAPIADRPKLKLADYLLDVPEHPETDAAPSLAWPMDGNDKWGDCVVAGADHARQAIWTQLLGEYTNWTEEQIVTLFRTQNPDFDPASDANDDGMVIQVFLEYLRKQGFILAFAAVDHTKPEEVKAACYLFEAVTLGVNLTQANMDQFNAGEPWDVVKGSPDLGGHDVPIVGYGDGSYQPVTWGRLHSMTDAFLAEQVEEAWVIFCGPHFQNPSFRAGLDVDKLRADFTTLTGEQAPLPQGPPSPPEDADQAFIDVLTPWMNKRHEGENRQVAIAARTWVKNRASLREIASRGPNVGTA